MEFIINNNVILEEEKIPSKTIGEELSILNNISSAISFTQSVEKVIEPIVRN